MTTKQCGNCEFWDKENAINSTSFANKKLAECRFPVPICVSKTMTYEDGGKDCPVYVERQDVSEEDEDQPEENGYTRADEDWFFDDKDD